MIGPSVHGAFVVCDLMVASATKFQGHFSSFQEKGPVINEMMDIETAWV